MDKNEVKGDKPDYKGRIDVAAWHNTDRNGKTYLSVVIGNRVNLFPIEKELKTRNLKISLIEIALFSGQFLFFYFFLIQPYVIF